MLTMLTILADGQMAINGHICATNSGKWGYSVTGVTQCGSVAQNMPLGPPDQEKKEMYCHITFTACESNFCEPNFQEFRLK